MELIIFVQAWINFYKNLKQIIGKRCKIYNLCISLFFNKNQREKSLYIDGTFNNIPYSYKNIDYSNVQCYLYY